MYGDLVAVAEAAVVKIRCTDIGQSGSGFLVSPNGHVVTNNHVVAEIKLVDGALRVEYSSAIRVIVDGHEHSATLACDATADRPIVYDYAILRIDELKSTPHLAVGDVSKVRRGDDVVCLGFPLDFDVLIATNGIVSAIASRPSHVNALHQLRTVVSNALIQYGNSGGPMLHVPSGKVIGINTLKHSIPDAVSHRLKAWCDHAGAAAFPLIRDLADFTLRYSYVGLNHAVSVEHVCGDANWPAQNGVQTCQ